MYISIKKMKNEKSYMVLLLICLVVHIVLPLNWADDAVFFEKSRETGLLTFLTGSARPLTDALTFVFSSCNALWRVLNPFVITALAMALSKMIPSKNEKTKKTIICCAIIFPSLVVVDAGFIATSVNYLWPVTFGLLCLFPLRAAYLGVKTRIGVALLLIPFLLYALNMQQMAVVLAVVLLAGCIILIIEKKRFFYVLIQLIVCVCGLVYSYSLNVFGENSRMIRETIRYYPNFAELNVFKKVELGFSSTMYCLTMKPHFAWAAFLAFSLLLAIISKRYKLSWLKRAVIWFPFVFSLIFGLLSFIPDKYIPFMKCIMGSMHHYKMTKAVYSFEVVPDILFCIVCLCVLYSMFVYIKNKTTFLACVGVFLLGLGSRMLMGFSPTVWASGYRTFFIMFVSFIIIAVIVIDNCFEKTAADNANICNQEQAFFPSPETKEI